MHHDPKELLEQHGEKAALGLALLVIAYVLLTTGGAAHQIQDELDRAIGQIERNLESHLPETELPPQLSVESPFATIREPWSPQTTAPQSDLPWAHYMRPRIKLKPFSGPAPHRLSSVGPLRADADLRRIAVSWGRAPSRLELQIGGKVETRYNRKRYDSQLLGGREFDAFLGYIVEREQVGRPGKTYRVFERRGDVRFEETSFEPETTYRYRVRAFWRTAYTIDRSDRRLVAASPRIELDGARVGVLDLAGYQGRYRGRQVAFTRWSNVEQVATPRNVVLRFHHDAMSHATFAVWQFWRGQWWRVVLRIKPGQDIGGRVSPRQLLNDAYNKRTHAADPAYQALQKAAKPGVASIGWRSGYVFVRTLKKGRAQVALLEHQEVRMRGGFGLDWGQRTVELERGKGKP